MSNDPWVWIAALLSLCIFSFLYKDNPFYRIAENIFVGVANGYFITQVYYNVVVPDIYDPIKGSIIQIIHEGWSWSLLNPAQKTNLMVIVPAIIGGLYITRFIPRLSWMVRIPIGIMMGYASAVAIVTSMEASVIKQVSATILTRAHFTDPWTGLWNLVVFAGVFATLYYFYFSRKDSGISRYISMTGITFVMIGFGASFGLTVMGRVALAIGRIVFLLKDWLGIVQ